MAQLECCCCLLLVCLGLFGLVFGGLTGLIEFIFSLPWLELFVVFVRVFRRTVCVSFSRGLMLFVSMSGLGLSILASDSHCAHLSFYMHVPSK